MTGTACRAATTNKKEKSGRSDSNRRMLAWKANALPLGDARVAFILADSLWLSNYSHI